jgi:hypothetical protein
MVDEIKSIKDAIRNTILSSGSGEDDHGDRLMGRMARDVINQILSKAGKSKDDIIQVLGREIGIALAAMLKQPLEQLVESKKVRITVELVGKATISAASERVMAPNSKKATARPSRTTPHSRKSKK